MRLQHRVPLLSAGGAGGGGGGASLTVRDGTTGVSYGYGTAAATDVEIGDLIIFGRNYRGSGTGTPGAPTISGITAAAATAITANTRYDTLGVSDGGYSCYWTTATSAGTLNLSVSADRANHCVVISGYNTVVQSAFSAGDADETPSLSLSSTPTGPVVALLLGGGATDTTEPSGITAGYTQMQPYYESTSGGYHKFFTNYSGTDQTFGATVTASQVISGGSGIVLLELGNA